MRRLSLLLTFLLIFTISATSVFATDEPVTEEPVEEQVEEVSGSISVARDASNGVAQTEQRFGNLKTVLNGLQATITWEGNTQPYTFSVTRDNQRIVSKVLMSPKYIMTIEYGGVYEINIKDKNGSKLAARITGPSVAAPVMLGAYPDYHSVTVKWQPSTGAQKYIVTRSDGQTFETNATSYRDTSAKKDVNYSYTVKAVTGNYASPASASTSSVGRVRTAYYYCTFKNAVKLKSHDRAKKAYTFQKGQTIKAEGFRQGSYLFRYNGRPYEAKWFRMGKRKGDISTGAYVNSVTAENYVNHSGYGSKTGYLIWVSLYSQRVFIFNGSAGNWTLINRDDHGNDGWLCGTGTPKTPTPSGMSKMLHTKKKRYSKHKYWNMFSGTAAIHGSNGKKEIKKLGRLISNGCVRVTNSQSLWIMNNVPLRTRVIIF